MLMGFVLLKFLLLLLLVRKMYINPYRPIRNFELYSEVSYRKQFARQHLSVSIGMSVRNVVTKYCGLAPMVGGREPCKRYPSPCRIW